MNVTNLINLDHRNCRLGALSLSTAKDKYRSSAAFLCVTWIIFLLIVIKIGLFNEAESVKDSDVATIALFAIIGLGISVGLMVEANQHLRTARDLDLEGLVVQGVIIDRWQTKLNEKNPLSTYVAYQFSYLDRLWLGKIIAESYPYNKLQTGESITLCFLPRNPSVSRIEPESIVFKHRDLSE